MDATFKIGSVNLSIPLLVYVIPDDSVRMVSTVRGGVMRFLMAPTVCHNPFIKAKEKNMKRFSD
jgi:hypothetical protein